MRLVRQFPGSGWNLTDNLIDSRNGLEKIAKVPKISARFSTFLMKKQKESDGAEIDSQATQKHGQHESRLISYAAAVGAFLAGGAAVNADVIFYDLSGAPQSTTSNGSLYFNFETGAVSPTAPVTPASGTFHLHQSTVPTARSSATRHAAVVFGLPAGNGAASIAVSNGNPPSAQDLASHAPIASSRRFQTHGTLYANSESIGNGRWHPGQDTGYLGVTFKDANGVHYGWALVTLNNDVSTTLRGFAYETVANKSIQAGQIPLLLTKAVSRKTQGAADRYQSSAYRKPRRRNAAPAGR